METIAFLVGKCMLLYMCVGLGVVSIDCITDEILTRRTKRHGN